jgi:hypothetical protein
MAQQWFPCNAIDDIYGIVFTVAGNVFWLCKEIQIIEICVCLEDLYFQ